MNINRMLDGFLKKAHNRKNMRRVIALLSVFVLLFTVNNVKFKAVTLESGVNCGYAEHLHDSGCYDGDDLICDRPEHLHDATCYRQASDDMEIRADGVDPEAGERAGVALAHAEDSYDAAETTVAMGEDAREGYVVGTQQPFYLSDVIASQGLDIVVGDVVEIGQVLENDDDPALFRSEKTGDDVAFFALSDFARAELALTVASGEVVTVELLYAIAPAATEQTAEAEIPATNPDATPAPEAVAQPVEETREETTLELVDEEDELPTAEPTEVPEAEPSEEPTEEPEAEPTAVPMEEEKEEIEVELTEEPTEEPTVEPTVEPTEEITVEPTVEPTEEITVEPTEEPEVEPTEEPEAEPTVEPTEEPEAEPTVEPTEEPEVEPTVEPSEEPEAEPTVEPTEEPEAEPIVEVTETPEEGDTEQPAVAARIDIDFTGIDVKSAGEMGLIAVNDADGSVSARLEDLIRFGGDCGIAVSGDALADAALEFDDDTAGDALYYIEGALYIREDGEITLHGEEGALTIGVVGFAMPASMAPGEGVTVVAQEGNLLPNGSSATMTSRIDTMGDDPLVGALRNQLAQSVQSGVRKSKAKAKSAILSTTADDARTTSEQRYAIFDVSVLDAENRPIEETGAVEVTLRPEINLYQDLPANIQNVRVSNLALYHYHGGEFTDTKIEACDFDDVSGEIRELRFVTNSFSEWVLSYTVDFEYVDPATGEKTIWKWPGSGSYAIASILAEIDVTGEIGDVSLERIEDRGGASDVLYLEEKQDGWYLTSDEAFTDTFELTVRMSEDDSVYTFIVTDDLPKHTVYVNVESGIDSSVLEYINIVLKKNFIKTDWNNGLQVTSEGYRYDSTKNKYVFDSVEGNTYHFDSYEVLLVKTSTSNPNYDHWMLDQPNNFTQYTNNSTLEGGYTVKIETVGDTSTITIGNPVPTTYTASIDFVEGETNQNDAVSLSGTTLEARDASGNTYTANVTKGGALSFSGLDTGAKLPEITSWTFKQNGNEVTALGDYVVSGLTVADTSDSSVKNYAFTARKPLACAVTATIDNIAPIGSDHYYVLARKGSTAIGYAALAQGSLNFTDGGSAVAIDDTTAFSIVRSEDALGSLAAVEAATDRLDAPGTLGLYAFDWSGASNGTITISATGRANTAELALNGHAPVGNVYVVATADNQPMYFAPLSEPLAFRDAAGKAVDYLPAGLTFIMKKSESACNSLSDVNSAARIDEYTDASGKEYILNVTADETNRVYRLSAQDKPEGGLGLTFYGYDGTTRVYEANLSDQWYVVGKDKNNNQYYFAAIDKKSGTLGTLMDQNGNVTSDSPVFTEFCVTRNNSGQNLNGGNLWNANDSEKLKDGGLMDTFRLVYPTSDDISKGVYQFKAVKQAMYAVEVRFEDASGATVAPQSRIDGNNFKVIAVFTRNGVKYGAAQDVGQVDFASKSFLFNEFADASGNKINYSLLDDVEVYFGPDISLNNDRSVGNVGNDVVNGSVLTAGSQNFTVSKSYDADNTKTTYVGHPATPYRVKIELKDENGNAVNSMPDGSYSIKASLTKGGKTYYATANIPGFSNGVAEASLGVFAPADQNDKSRVAFSAGDRVRVSLVSNDSSKPTITGGQLMGDYYFTATEDTENGVTTFLGRKGKSREYEVRAEAGNIEFTNGPWYVYAEASRDDGIYFYSQYIQPGQSSFTGSVSGFHRWALADGGLQEMGTAAVIPDENLTFFLVRGKDHDNNSTSNRGHNVNGTNSDDNYFGNPDNINCRALSGASVDNYYTLEVKEESDKTVLLLKKGVSASIAVEAYDRGNQKQDEPDLNSSYYIVGRLAFRDGTEDKLGFAAQQLGDGTTLAINDGFTVPAYSDEKQYLTGTRAYEPMLAYVPADSGLDSASAVINAISSGNAGVRLYRNGDAVESYRLTTANGTRENPNTVIKLEKLPLLTSSAEVKQADGATANEARDNVNRYYLLAELTRDGEVGYAYRQINTQDVFTTDEAAFESFTATDGKTLYYAPEDAVRFYVVKGNYSDLKEVVASPNRYAEGQEMGCYIPSFAVSGNSVKAVLTEHVQKEGVPFKVQVRLLEKDLTALKEKAELTGQYQVLAWLTRKGSGSSGQPLAWTILNVDESDLNDGAWTETIAEDGFAVCNANLDATGDQIGYNADDYDINLRLYHADSDYTTLNELRAHASDGAPQGFDIMGVYTAGSATRQMTSKEITELGNNAAIIKLHKAYDKVYGIKVALDEAGLEISEDENYIVKVTLEHESDNPKYSYAFAKLIVNGTDCELAPISDANGNIWRDDNGTIQTGDGYKFTGNEKGVSIEILAANGTDNFAEWVKGGASSRVKEGESINLYSWSVGERQTVEDVANEKTAIYDVIHFKKDEGGISKGDLDTYLEYATNFGLYTGDLALHATDMESNIGAAKVTGSIGADYGFSSNNVMVNRITVTKKYLDANGDPAVGRSVKLNLYTVDEIKDDGSYTLLSGARTATGTTDSKGVAELEFDKLPAGTYVLKEEIGGKEYTYDVEHNSGIVEAGGTTIRFKEKFLIIDNINVNVNYFGDIQTSGNDFAILRHSRNGWIVVGNEADYIRLNELNDGLDLAKVSQAGTKDYPMTYDIPGDLRRLSTLSARLAASSSSPTVRVINLTYDEINDNHGIDLRALNDNRYIVVNVDMTGVGSSASMDVRTTIDGHTLNADFGAGGKEDSARVLYNFVTRGADGSFVPYTGKINTKNVGAGVLLAPSATVADLGGNWGGTIVCARAEHTGSEIHSDSENKIQKINTVLTNSESQIRQGELELRKALVGDALDNTTWFTFDVALKDAQGQPLSGAYIATGLPSGNTVTFDAQGRATVRVRANNSVTITGLPEGARYSVREVFNHDSEHYQLVHMIDSDGTPVEPTQNDATPAVTGTIEADNTDTVQAVNTRKKGGLTVTKAVVGDETGSRQFKFRVKILNESGETDTSFKGAYGSMIFKAGVAEFDLGNGGFMTAKAKGIPEGTRFSLEEVEANQDGYETTVKLITVDKTVIASADDKCVVTGFIPAGEDANALIASYVNTHSDGPGKLTVTKTVKLNGEADENHDGEDKTFWVALYTRVGEAEPYTYALAADVGDNPRQITVNKGSATGEVAFEDLTLGQTYYVFEVENNGGVVKILNTNATTQGYTVTRSGEQVRITKDAKADIENDRRTTVDVSFNKQWLTFGSSVKNPWPAGATIKVVITRDRTKDGETILDEGFELAYVIDENGTEFEFEAGATLPQSMTGFSGKLKRVSTEGNLHSFRLEGLESAWQDETYTYYISEAEISGASGHYSVKYNDEPASKTSRMASGGTITNENATYALPSTGGSGTALYTASGLAMILIAAALLLRRRRQDRESGMDW